jgi:serine/threonine protein kinase
MEPPQGRLLARVRHPNVVTIYGAERIGDRSGLWMELVKGRTLEETLQNRKVFTASEVIGIGLELCHAVSAVHQADLLHRDIKAQNVMIGEGGRVLLMDFGAGRELNGSCASVAGTPLYLAPELLNGSKATIQTDVYSLGVLLYHLLTNSYPVRGRDLRELREAHRRDESTPLASVRRDLSARLTRGHQSRSRSRARETVRHSGCARGRSGAPGVASTRRVVGARRCCVGHRLRHVGRVRVPRLADVGPEPDTKGAECLVPRRHVERQAF